MQRTYSLKIRALTIKADASGGVPDDLQAALDAAQQTLGDLWPEETLKRIVSPVFHAVEKFSAANSSPKLKGIHLPAAKVASLQDDFINTNVDLIKSIEERFHDGLAQYLAEEIAAGDRWEDISTTIQERYDVSESQADTIARDQVSKANGDLAKERQADAGVTEFIWRTAGDERVRDSHAELDGSTFSWADGAPGEDAYPSSAVNCRCWAEPVIPGL